MPRVRIGLVIIAILIVGIFLTTTGSCLDSFKTSDDEVAVSEAQAQVTVTGFELVTPSTPDPQDATMKVAATQDIIVRAHVEHVKELFVVASRGARDVDAVASAKPDANGDVTVKLHLPKTDTAYTLQAAGKVEDKLRSGWQGGFFNSEPAVPASNAISIIARPSSSTLRPAVLDVELLTYDHVDPNYDPRGGGPVYIVPADIVVRFRTTGVEEVLLDVTLSATTTLLSVSGRPDANGNVEIPLHLPPSTGAIFVLQGQGVVAQALARDWRGAVRGPTNIPVVPFPRGFRVALMGN
ncbi:MAG TPA: hypothetical protein VI759_08795 [Dehalococcoidia bacterium]|nr:hypothetical protein [Dehalococcoidia bacterium]